MSVISRTEAKMLGCALVGMIFLFACLIETEISKVASYAIVSVMWNLAGMYYASKAMKEL